MGFEVLTAVNGSVLVILIMTPCGLVGRPEYRDNFLLRNVGILPTLFPGTSHAEC
jgi:hypothetical protein